MDSVRQQMVVGNWKMNKTIPEAIRYITELKNKISGKREVEIVVAPPFTSLDSVSIALQNTNVKLAAQNMCWDEYGAYTGEVSGKMLSSLGCTYVIIGHSERRQYFNETNSMVNKKLKQAIEDELLPIVCIGESEAERKANKTFDVLNIQIRESLKNLRPQDAENIVIAYEPVWAIGTGISATPSDAEKAHEFIRNTLRTIFGGVVSDKMKILYGGSVTHENIKEIMAVKNVDGVLVGGSSLNPATFASIIKFNEDHD